MTIQPPNYSVPVVDPQGKMTPQFLKFLEALGKTAPGSVEANVADLETRVATLETDVTTHTSQITTINATLALLGTAANQNYSTGTWTPTIAGSTTAGTQTYSQQVGTYIKIGTDVVAWCRILMTALDGTTAGNIMIAGLPFTVTNASPNQIYAGTIAAINNIAHVATMTQFGLRAIPNSTTAGLIEFGQLAGGASASVPVASLAATTAIQATLLYQST